MTCYRRIKKCRKPLVGYLESTRELQVGDTGSRLCNAEKSFHRLLKYKKKQFIVCTLIKVVIHRCMRFFPHCDDFQFTFNSMAMAFNSAALVGALADFRLNCE